MGFFSTFYLNYFSVGMLIPVLFHLFLAIFLFSIRNRSKATFHLAMGYALWVVFNLAYFAANSFYHPLAAYHRWFTVGSVLFIITHFNMIHFYFPDERAPRFGRIYFIVSYAVAALVSLAFIASTIHGRTVYQINAHYWDFDADTFSKYFSLLMLLYIFIQLPLALWRTVTTKSRDRWISLTMGIFLFVSGLAPGVTNTLSRDGAMDRELYQVSWVIFNVLCFAAAAIIYLNSTRDRTSFIGKLITITGVAFLLVVQFIAYFALTDKDRGYDFAHQHLTARVLISDYRPDDFSYRATYALDTNRFIGIERAPGGGAAVDHASYRQEFINAALLGKIRSLPTDGFQSRIMKLLDETPAAFAGYRAFIQNELGRMPREETRPARRLLARLDGAKRIIAYRANKIRALPEKGFRESLVKFASKKEGDFEPFRAALMALMNDASRTDAELRRDALSLLEPMNGEGVRLYRTDPTGQHHYIAYVQFDPAANAVHEVGYSYRAYREFIHPFALTLIIILAALLVIVRFGFQYFFMGALVAPLRTLSRGVRLVNNGDLDVTVPVRFEDEIGFITHAFNNMVGSIRDSKKKLEEYAQTLETKVEERTAELKSARDQLWGEMQLAKKIQTVLLPDRPEIEGFQIAAYMQPADEVGGDYYDIINVDGLDWLVIGDVSGHGVPAGLIMMMVQTAIHTALAGKPNLKPQRLLSHINQVVTANIKKLNEDKYMTITVLACLKNGTFYFSGLHQDIMIYRAATKTVELVETDGIWIGLVEDINGMLHDSELTLSRGDVMFLYTDGITESWRRGARKDERDPESDMFGDERLKSCLLTLGEKEPEEIKQGILDAMRDYMPADDVTLLVVKRSA
ncbi:MAG TPA: SpoIIE family protein phosphatase [Spirochaetota bacterium]|mgnify:CR=1 FL=1|nr:SpoIIE family protein phosphatase [Spirochaetota bacterium]HPU89923.1 SpoIIE family protein phosphatase [Spirochaetota bacterium]